jgi:AcrR family transcriptional regulator
VTASREREDGSVPGRKVPEAERREQLLAAAYLIAVRDGLDQVTARRVADEAGSSPGLVFFHFGSKDGLLLALLEHLLAGALDAEVTPAIAVLASPVERLLALLRIEVEGLPEQRGAVELFFAYWVSLGRQAAFRDRISRALEDYRDVFVPVCVEVADELGLEVSGDALATYVVSLIEGAAVQVVRDLARFDTEAFLSVLAHQLRSPTALTR